MSSTAAPLAPATGQAWWRGLARRELHSYPPPASRFGYLGLTVVITIVLYYMAYCGGSVSTLQMADLHISFHFAVWVAAVGNVLGAVAAYFAGITDRIGRVAAVIIGLTAASLITLFAIPNSPNRWVFAVLTLLVGKIEGIVLVATPALIRDFSPQAKRGGAMGLWTLGPVVGSLIVSLVGTWTIHGTPAAGFWSHEYLIAGAAGMVVSVFAAVFLRELAPELRDQLMVSEADRLLIEAKARGLDVEASTRHRVRQMFKPDIIISGFAVSVLLLAYYTAIALGVVLAQVVFGFSLHQANALGNWMWGVNALTVVLVGVISDRLLVRKPFMVVGAAIAAVSIVLYLERFGHRTSFATVAILISAISFGMGVAYTPWMASFTETVEARNPALTATGLGVWGLTLRVVIFVMLILAPIVITTVTPLVNFTVRTTPYTATLQYAAAHPAEAHTVLAHVPPKVLSYAATHSGSAIAAEKRIPSQVRTWYWICFAGPVIFLLCVPLLKGRWSPRRARQDFEAYEAAVQAQLATLQSAEPGAVPAAATGTT